VNAPQLRTELVFRFNKAFDVPDIHFGPAAFRSPRREFLKPGIIIMCPLLAINPAIAERLIQGLSVGDGLLAGILFENAQPNTIRGSMILLQPVSECRGRFESQYF
jgi:hypothetical protein